MQATVTPKKETSQVEINVTVDAKEFKPYIDRAAKQLGEQNPIKGFRPGKAPVSVIAEHFGQERLLHEAMDLALPRFFVAAALDHDVEAINRPSISVKELGLDTPFAFSAVVDVLPEVTLGDPKSITATRRKAEVGEDQIEKELQYLARMRSKYIDIARPAQEGDIVTVDFMVRMNGTPMEGGSSKNHPITLGEGHFVPDFEKGLMGIKGGENRTYSITFPADFQNKDLQGKVAEVEVTAHAVQQRVVPEINDEFVRTLGKFKDLANLKEELTKNIKEELEHKEEDRFMGEIAEKLAEKSTFGHIPEVLIEKEIDARLEELARMLSMQNKTVDTYLAETGKTVDALRVEMREEATRHVKVGLSMRAFAKAHEIDVTDDEIEAKANEHLRAYEHVPQAQQNIDLDDLKERVSSTLRNQKVLQKLAEIVTITKA